MSSTKVRSERQLLNDKACSERMKAYHEQIKHAKEQLILEQTKAELEKAKPLKLKKADVVLGKQLALGTSVPSKSVKELIETYEPESITPLKNPPDELDIPLRTNNKRPYVKRKHKGDSVVYSA